MEQVLAVALASCRSFGEIAQSLVEAGIYNHDFTGCLIAQVGEDGRVRELGRFGIFGPGPSSESVPLWDDGLIAKSLKQQSPTFISNAVEIARARQLTPSSDIDDLIVINEFQSVMAIPIRNRGLLTGVVGLCSVSLPEQQLEIRLDYGFLQAVVTLAMRSMANTQSSQASRAIPLLTARDRAVLDLLARGLTNKEIATELKLSLATAKLTVSNLLGKLGSTNRQSAVDKAHELGLVS